MSKGDVYFIKPVEADGPVKIGFSERPASRLERFSVWSPIKLELIGSVPGSFADEHYLHQCFSKSHSHREWFFSTPDMVRAISEILSAGTVEAVKGWLKPVGPLQRKDRSSSSPEGRLCRSYTMRVIWLVKRRRVAGENTRWDSPSDVRDILYSWSSASNQDGVYTMPSEAEIARLEDYLADPEKHSVYPFWVAEKPAPDVLGKPVKEAAV